MVGTLSGLLTVAQARRLFSPETTYLNSASYGLPPRPAFEAHYPHLIDRLNAEKHVGKRHEPYGGVSELGVSAGPRQGPRDPDPT